MSEVFTESLATSKILIKFSIYITLKMIIVGQKMLFSFWRNATDRYEDEHFALRCCLLSACFARNATPRAVHLAMPWPPLVPPTTLSQNALHHRTSASTCFFHLNRLRGCDGTWELMTNNNYFCQCCYIWSVNQYWAQIRKTNMVKIVRVGNFLNWILTNRNHILKLCLCRTLYFLRNDFNCVYMYNYFVRRKLLWN